MKVMVTGAGGRIGRLICARLTSAGHEVVGFDIGAAPENESVADWVTGDITVPGDVAPAVQGCDGVVHMAAVPLHIDGAEVDTCRANVLGTVNVVDAAMRAGVGRIVSASSICAAGLITSVGAARPTALPITEDFDGGADDMYGMSKRFGELVGEAYGRRHGTSVVSLRLASVNFPDDPAFEAFMTTVFDAASDPDPLMRDIRWQYVDARDVVQAVELALTTPGVSGTYNVGAADTPGSDWRIWAAETFGDVPDDAVAEDLRSGADRPIWSIDRARSDLGYAPRHSWKEYPAVVAGVTAAAERAKR